MSVRWPVWPLRSPEHVSNMIEGLEYQELHRRGPGATAFWRSLLGTALLIFLFLVLPAVLAVFFVLGLRLSGDTAGEITRFLELDPVTPLNLAYLNLGLAVAIGSAIFVNWLMHGRLAPRWLLSVAGRIRLRWLLVCVGLSVVTMVITLLVGSLLPGDASGPPMHSQVNAFTAQTVGFALVLVFLTPLQAAGEEFAFRGYVIQSWGGVAAARSRRTGRVVAVVISATLFALAHGGQDVPVFADRFAFGVVAGCLVIATGGLEAGLAMHVVNNWVAFGSAVLFGDVTQTLTISTGSWWMLISTATQSMVYVGLVLGMARRMRIQSRSVLESSTAAL